jgi:hypothetical protein
MLARGRPCVMVARGSGCVLLARRYACITSAGVALGALAGCRPGASERSTAAEAAVVVGKRVTAA